MATTYTSETEKVAAAPPPETRAPAKKAHTFALAEVVLRFLLFASGLVAVLVMVTSKQTKYLSVPGIPYKIPRSAVFDHSPAFIYFVAALSVAGFYGLITTLFSLYALIKPGCCPKVLSHFVIFDVLLLGIVASATGSGGAVAYIGLKGNKYVNWGKICHMYGDFCKHVGASIAVSLFGSVILVLLVLLSIHSLSKRIPK
ncbi:hypothetical protein MIMGU_mgv1a025880mg [Erythranthe guttata]|uniref:CASP-like protein n=1 Tax=Erythranthe guttata TaxID=4155 RepID=A0A022RVW0_ERYGU|nr:PREDICTED: CASP-like protein 1 [Erythranthe guttata]EYU43898.1 hypothetical protein MIMGU_mgv1a025880mg [Erythranthe guttata]|eukprot:XP_012858780.1 PREDICTED: CASP-like protein 1 [Erythranthe guttata]